jgi:hypothetical protein
MFTPLITALLFFQTAPGAAIPDQVVLKSGEIVSGRIVKDWPDSLRVRTGKGDVEIRRENVSSVRSLELSLEQSLDRWDAMPRDDPRALEELARFCQLRGLPGGARDAWLHLLLLDPSSELAARAIGAHKVDGQWESPVRGTWIKLSDFLGPKDRWRRALDLKTGHFLVRTDLPPERVLQATVDLERHYERFYRVFGAELGLYSFGEVPVVNVYSHAADYPAPPIAGEKSWFEPSNNQLHVLATELLDMRRITRDVNEMLLFNVLRRSSGRNGEMMPWAQRGIAECFAATSGAEPGDAWSSLESPSYDRFTEQVDDGEPVSLTRLLNTSLSEFKNDPDGERRSTRAYTFVYFLMNGDGGAHRADFCRYLREAWLGRGGRMLLYKTLGMNAADLEKRWQEYVKHVLRSRSPVTQ